MIPAPSGRSLPDHLGRLLCSERPETYRRFGLALLVFFATLVIAQCVQGAAPMADPWDPMIILDGAWRIIHGQVPHTDFHNQTGALVYLLTAFGMTIAAPSTASILYGNVLLLAMLLPCVWRVAAARLPAVAAFTFVLFAGVLLMAPRPLGYNVLETSYGMIYNRQGYVLLAILFVCVFLPPRTPSSRSHLAIGACAGVLMGLLLFCKITYFALALPSVAVAAVIDARMRRALVPCAIVMSAVCVAFFALFHISTPAYLADLAVTVASQAYGVRRILLIDSCKHDAMAIGLFAIFLVTWTRSAPRATSSLQPAWIVAVWMIGVTLGIGMTNTSQGGDLDEPLYFVTAMVTLELLRRRHSAAVNTRGHRLQFVHAVALLVSVAAFCAPILAKDAASLTYSTRWLMTDGKRVPVERQFHSVRLQDFRVPDEGAFVTAYWPSSEHPAGINEGIDLLNAHMRAGDRVTTMAFTNPFSFALGLMPARDGLLWWQLDFSFSQRHFPAPDNFLGEASLVMIPRDTGRGWEHDTVDALLDLYAPYLHTHFAELARTERWVLFRRRLDTIR